MNSLINEPMAILICQDKKKTQFLDIFCIGQSLPQIFSRQTNNIDVACKLITTASVMQKEPYHYQGQDLYQSIVLRKFLWN